LAYLHRQSAFRGLIAYTISPEAETLPSVNGSFGVQGIGTGNPGYGLSLDKNFVQPEGTLNVFAGLGYRSNEDHLHPLGGVRYEFNSGFTLGLQADGHELNPFVTYRLSDAFGGLNLINGRRPAFIIGYRW